MLAYWAVIVVVLEMLYHGQASNARFCCKKEVLWVALIDVI